MAASMTVFLRRALNPSTLLKACRPSNLLKIVRPSNLRRAFSRSNLLIAAIVVMAFVLGCALPIYAGMMGNQIGKVAALPALLAFGILLVYDHKMMVLLIVLARASGDVLFQSTRFGIGGYQVGIGGLINAFVIFIALFLVFERPGLVPKKAARAWFVFLAVALVGIAISPVKGDAVRSWLVLSSYFAMFSCAFHFVHRQSDFRFCIKLVLCSSAGPVLYSFIDMAIGASYGPDGFRLKSTFGHANEFAFFLIPIITLAFYIFKTMVPEKNLYGVRYEKSNLLQRVAMGLYIFLLLGLLVLTKTRSAWVACFLGFFLYAIFFEQRYLVYLGILGVVGMFIPGVADRIADLAQGNEAINYAKLNSFAWRVSLWESGLRWMARSHYLFGYGLQSFKEYSTVFFPLAGITHWNAHSVIVQIFFELGLAGLAAFVALYYMVLRELKKMLKIDRLGAFSLIVILINYVICAFSDNLLDYLSFNWYLWFVFGAGWALVRVRAAEDAKKMHLERPQPGAAPAWQ